MRDIFSLSFRLPVITYIL